jgi:hypothetical protein
MQNFSTHFKTRDLQIACALHASGQRVLRLDWKDGRAFFVFEDGPRCEGLVQAYWNRDLILPAKDFFSAMRELKDRIFQAERDSRGNR